MYVTEAKQHLRTSKYCTAKLRADFSSLLSPFFFFSPKSIFRPQPKQKLMMTSKFGLRCIANAVSRASQVYSLISKNQGSVRLLSLEQQLQNPNHEFSNTLTEDTSLV